MKNLLALVILFFASNITFAQDVAECEKIVLQTYEAVNNKNSDPIMKHLSDDFSIAGQKGEIAKMVLPQIIQQLNMQVKNIKKISETKTDVLTFVYESELGGAITNSTFVFNDKNQLKTLELIEMQVKTLSMDELEVVKDDQKHFTIPFKRVRKLISIEAKIDGKLRTFLVDNGAPVLVLNSAYTGKIETNTNLNLAEAKGVGGSVSMDIKAIENFEMGGISMKNQKVVTMDLSHLEKETKTTFYGLIGYSVYKDYDLLFDYKKKTLTFIKPEATDEYLKNQYKNKTQFETAIELGAHIPVVNVLINNKKYAVGIDCGAETNLFDVKLMDELKNNLSNKRKDLMGGADKNTIEVTSGKLDLLKIGAIDYKKTKTVFSDISHMNDGYELKLDGLIGYDILSKQPTLISFKNKKIIFIK